MILLVFFIVRNSFATESASQSFPPHDATTDDQGQHGTERSDGSHLDGNGEHENLSFSVFHVNFEHVELPFIIALWIFVSSLAKVGKCHTAYHR